MTFVVRDTSRDTERECSSRSEAEETKADMVSLGANPEDIEIIAPKASDGGTESVEAEPVADTTVEEETEPQPAQEQEILTEANEAIDQLGEELGTDPLSILPSHMIDEISGQPAINKRGYAMIAERYGIETTADVVEYPWDNPENRCVAKATAVTEDGKTYTGWATASVEDGDMSEQIIELAETRSLKRSISWASGVGIVSYQEMMSELE